MLNLISADVGHLFALPPCIWWGAAGAGAPRSTFSFSKVHCCATPARRVWRRKTPEPHSRECACTHQMSVPIHRWIRPWERYFARCAMVKRARLKRGVRVNACTHSPTQHTRTHTHTYPVRSANGRARNDIARHALGIFFVKNVCGKRPGREWGWTWMKGDFTSPTTAAVTSDEGRCAQGLLATLPVWDAYVVLRIPYNIIFFLFIYIEVDWFGAEQGSTPRSSFRWTSSD